MSCLSYGVRPVSIGGVALAAMFAAADVASAQPVWTYRARASAETTGTDTNRSSPLVPPTRTGWDAAGLFAGSADGAWNAGDRLRLATGVSFTAAGGDVDVRAREAYARLSATSWMDLEAGKRLLRWGVGYGFSPTGVLDPPRAATDPADRLGRNSGMWLARADLFRGSSSLTIAAAAPQQQPAGPFTPDRLVAARLHTLLGGGVELALVGSAGDGLRPSYGANATHVVGQRLEWHGELLWHDRGSAGGRTFSAAAGLQYTFAAGVNVVVEYHRNGRGLNDDEWTAVMHGQRSPGAAPGRRQFLFVRAAAAGADRRIAPELIVIAGLDDGGWTAVPAITWTAHRRVQVYARATHLVGPRRSTARFAPWKTAITAGTAVRF